MDIFTLAYYWALLWLPVIAYFVLIKKTPQHSKYSTPAWYQYFKILVSRNVIKKYFKKNNIVYSLEKPEVPEKLTDDNEGDVHMFLGSDSKGNLVYIKFETRLDKHAEISLQIRLSDGRIFQFPNEPEVLLCSLARREWKGQGLEITTLEPMMRLRIVYNGFMKCGEKVGHFKINLIWTSISKPLVYPSEFDWTLFAEAISREPWKDGDWAALLGDRRGFDQYGLLHGEIGGSLLSKTVLLSIPTLRRRYHGLADCFALQRDFNIVVTTDEGDIFNVGARHIRKGCTQLRYGSVFYANGEFYSLKETDLSLEEVADAGNLPKVLTVHITTIRSTIKCILYLHPEQTETINRESHGWKMIIARAECNVDTNEGRAIITSFYSRIGEKRQFPPPILRELKPKDIKKFTLSLKDEECKISSLTGGKATSLGLLTSLNSEKFIVPEGFVVTVLSLMKQIESKAKLSEALDLFSVKRNLLQETCKRVTDVFKETEVNQDVAKEILEQVKKIKDISPQNEQDNIRWAVRSSALGEDSGDFSAAGQNQTILGCKTDEDILKAVTVCWASLYDYQSVRYRWEKGLPIKSGMAVVIQKMVPSEVSGVLFTRHPTNGDPSRMVISSNYGLGESVVSAYVDPDSITLKRTHDGQVTFEESKIGDKKVAIEMTDNSTSTITLDKKRAMTLSLKEDLAVKLGKVGVELEERFGNGRDIEWAYCGDDLYLLQARPITTLNSWTEYELIHELDEAIICEHDFSTTANVTEVIPRAITTLTNKTMISGLNDPVATLVTGRPKDPFRRICIFSSASHAFLSISNLILAMPPTHQDPISQSQQLSIFGRLVITDAILQRAIMRNRPTNLKKFAAFKSVLQSAWNSDNFVEKAKSLAAYDIGIRKEMKLIELFEATEDYRKIFEKVAYMHGGTSQASTIYQSIAMLILLGKEENFRPEHYGDIAFLLSSCKDIISVQVPIILERIASLIRKSGKAKEFIGQNPKEGEIWLKSNIPEAHEEFERFLEVFGHRSFREFELMDPGWHTNPHVLISIIQNNCKAETVTKSTKQLSVEETLSKLKTPLNKIKLMLLKFFISKFRKAVSNRENTKSELIRVVNKMKIGYRILAERLFEEGYLPNKDLIFHMTPYEMKRIILERDPVIVVRAQRRLNLHKKLELYKFPELNFGRPECEEVTQVDSGNVVDGLVLQGTPIYAGEVTARCCCISNLDEIEQLENGDILVTHSTDIGWSPYFPMISGIVTELGGLISHGAVVAREYGLPALVGVQNATLSFKTGDIVKLSGDKGTLTRIKKVEVQKI